MKKLISLFYVIELVQSKGAGGGGYNNDRQGGDHSGDSNPVEYIYKKLHEFEEDENKLTAYEQTNCYDCAMRNGGLNYQCNYGGGLVTEIDGGDIVCCDPFSNRSYC